MRRLPWFMAVAACILVLSSSIVFAASSTNYSMTRQVVASGGGSASSTNYSTTGTVGQPSPVGASSSTSYANYGGFWHPQEVQVASVTSLPFTTVLLGRPEQAPQSAPIVTGPSSVIGDSVTLGWGAVQDASSYQVQRDTSSDFSSPGLDTTTTETSYTDSALAEGCYYYRVRACNSKGCGDWSTTKRVCVGETTALPWLMLIVQ